MAAGKGTGGLMNKTDATVEVFLRVPGNWEHPQELIARMPSGYQLTAKALILPDGTAIEFRPMPPDDQFAGVFQTACRHPATKAELHRVNGYTVNIGLCGPGGSMAAALTTMRAGAAIVRAGGAGVFIDNSVLAHGGSEWIEMVEDGSCDAVSFAFVNVVRDGQIVKTMGMHVLGLPDIVMRRADLDDDGDVIADVIRYLCRGEKPVGPGHVLAGETGPRFQVLATSGDELKASSPMHNPFGRWKLVSFKDAAECN